MTTKPEGIFSDGSLWYGEKSPDDDDPNTYWFTVGEGEYETKEIPVTFPLFTMTVFPDGTPGSFATEYMLARKTGDARFGSPCTHTRAKRGYCPDCLRRVK